MRQNKSFYFRWSFGILLWEIMSLGEVPYQSISTVENLFELLKQGKRMEQPSKCPDKMYVIMHYSHTH